VLKALRGGWAPNRDPSLWGRATLEGHGNSPTRAGQKSSKVLCIVTFIR
jgi:hypothetical protein